MASPQKEDGYMAIALEIQDALCRIRIPGEETQILNTILRKTYGWKKTEDAISLSQFAQATGMNKPHIIQAIKGLLLKKVIIVTENSKGPVKVYGFNKDYEQWAPLPKKVKLPKTVKSVTENSNPSLPKTVPTKEKKNLKDKKEKKAVFIFTLPDWIPPPTWQQFEEMRKAIKKPLTPYAAHLVTLELQKIRGKTGHDPIAVLNQSIANSWQDVYPLKEKGGNGNGQRQAPPGYRTDIRGHVVPDDTAAAIAKINADWEAADAAQKAAGDHARVFPEPDDVPDFESVECGGQSAP